jgi:RNA-directed DNA polymerase
VSEHRAVSVGMSRKSYWHLAKNEAINVSLSNACLKEQGLTSIKALWIRIHHPAKAR